YALYAASSIAACGTVIVAVIPGANKTLVEIIAAAVIVVYTFLGGFNAVCWTDFFQGMLMLLALMIVPIVAYIILQTSGPIGNPAADVPNYYNFLSSGKFDWASVSDILTGFGWGLGYFGMPHILVRYMSIRSEKEMKKSQITGSLWTALILLLATFVGLIAREFLGDIVTSDNKSSVFIMIVDNIFSTGALAVIGGLLLSAIVAASMSTADSQLLLSSSAFASDIYKTTIKKDASEKEVLWVGRIAVIVILVIAVLIALFVSSDIMSLVSAAWSIFGAAFGPAILLSLFWKRFNFKGAAAGIISGFVVSVLWMVLFNFPYYGFEKVIAATNLYEIVPGFIVGLITAVIVTLCTKKPDAETEKIFDDAVKMGTDEKVKEVESTQD
ncbi:MAG: sodium/proline symporter, partial [Clostridia bacterium]|nr:sodium/proline symporter [Clostridia bacterium]